MIDRVEEHMDECKGQIRQAGVFQRSDVGQTERSFISLIGLLGTEP